MKELIESFSWYATTQLRWDKRYEDIMRGEDAIGQKEYKILQQLWQGDKGHQEW